MPGTTLELALKEAESVLSNASDSARLDAELLLCAVLNKTRSYLHAHPEATLQQEQQQHYAQLIARRSDNEPLAYILGHKEFWSLNLHVGPGILVPRPETELLVELALARIPADQPCSIADLGTGSGAIALSIATERPQCHIIATDTSTTALDTARNNAAKHNITNIEFIHSEWYKKLQNRTFDVIVSNPPYVAADDPHLQSLQHEPLSALISHNQGLDDIEHLIKHAHKHLKPGGWLILEHGFEQAERVRDLFIQQGFSAIETNRDLAGLERATLAHT